MEPSSPKRIVAGALFALFVALIIAALAVFGVISMTLGHIFMICACAVGVLIIWTELIPAKPARHKLAFTVALIGIMFIADCAIVAIRRGENPLSIIRLSGVPFGAARHWWSGSHGRWFDKALGAIYALAFIFAVLFIAALGKVISTTASARKPKAAKGFLDYRLDVETAIADRKSVV